jgi:hypothetical protein
MTGLWKGVNSSSGGELMRTVMVMVVVRCAVGVLSSLSATGVACLWTR